MKDRVECRERLRGIFNITVTPFTEQGEIDFAGLAANIERVIDLGYDGVLIGGTYGEFPALSPEERATIFRHVMQVVGDRVPVEGPARAAHLARKGHAQARHHRSGSRRAAHGIRARAARVGHGSLKRRRVRAKRSGLQPLLRASSGRHGPASLHRNWIEIACAM